MRTLHEIRNAARNPIGLAIVAAMLLAWGVSPVWGAEWQHFDYGGKIKCMDASERSVWIGGEAGALRYDVETGRFLRVTQKTNMRGEQLELAGSIVRSIAVDSWGRTWFACWEKGKGGLAGAGITVMDPLGFTSFTEEDGLPSNEVYTLCADTRGRIWAGTKAGVAVFDDGRWTVYTTEDGLQRNDALEISIDAHGRVWCGFWRGVNVHDDGQWWTWQRKRVDYVYRIIPADDNRVYCATKGGMAVYDGERWEFIKNRGDLRKRLISDMAVDGEGRIWCAWGGYDKGIALYGDGKWSRLTRRSTGGGLAANRTMAVAADRHKRMWVGDRDGRISVMVPDGAPEVFDGALVKTSWVEPGAFQPVRRYASNERIRPEEPRVGRALRSAFAGLPSLNWTSSPWMGALQSLRLRDDELLAVSSTSRPLAPLPVERPLPMADLTWEDAEIVRTSDEPILLAQAGGGAPVTTDSAVAPTGVQLKIAEPKTLGQSTAEAPFETDRRTLEVSGMAIAEEGVKLAKIEVNGLEATLKEAIPFRGSLIHNFEAKVLLTGIDDIHLEVFDDKDRSQGFRDIPIKVLGPEAEASPPDIHFIKPGIPPEEVSAARGGGWPIEVVLKSANKGLVRGLVQDDTEVKNVLMNNEEVEWINDARPSELEEAGMAGAQNVKAFENSFRLNPGKNDITIQAVDIFDNVSQVTLDLNVQKALSDSMFYAQNHAMIVGIDRYRYWPQLKNAVRDAKGMRNMLVERFKFPEGNIHELYDEEASREGILKAFRAIYKAPKNSRVIIFYAGHGQTTPTRTGTDGFLIPHDGVATTSERPGLDVLDTWLGMDRLSKEIAYFEAKHILLIIDACYSGLMTAKRSAGFRGFGDENAGAANFIRIANQSAVEVITAGAQDEEVLDAGRPDGHSVFTGMLLDGIRTGKADIVADGVITSRELGAYLTVEVPQATGGRQHPQYAKLPGHEDEKGLVLFSISESG